jgi:hypothetical protein
MLFWKTALLRKEGMRLKLVRIVLDITMDRLEFVIVAAKVRTADQRTQGHKRKKKALIFLVQDLCARYKIADIAGHCEFANKACPCFDVKKEFKL